MVDVTRIELVSEAITTLNFYKFSLLLSFANIFPANRANKSYPLKCPSCRKGVERGNL